MNNRNSVLMFLSLSLSLGNSNSSWAMEGTRDFLERLYRNPQKVMDELPPKIRHWNGRNMSPHAFFRPSKAEGENKALVSPDTTDSDGNLLSDKAENLVDRGKDLNKNLLNMERDGLQQGRLPIRPWSDDYWAYRSGGIAFRYADTDITGEGPWKKMYKFHSEHPVNSYLEQGRIDDLSPAEKYDLLVGDEKGSLTASMWAMGKSSLGRNGDVESWMGFCDGWTAASISVVRPQTAVKVKSLDGKYDITFYPSDIKALATSLWTGGNPPVKSVGQRCDVKHPQKDSHGRITHLDCFDTNPGTWHMAVVNQIGVSQRGMVMDTSFDYEVWNQPVLGYSYGYFNPQTGKNAGTLDEGKIPMEKFSRDLFRSYRSPRAKSIVGIEMKVEYVEETSPSHKATDGEEDDALSEVVYRYDLELDGNDQIIGGEWYGNAHPDFLWTVEKGGRPTSQFENEAHGSWDPQAQPSVPHDWAHAGKQAGQQGFPLAKIVNALIGASSRR